MKLTVRSHGGPVIAVVERRDRPRPAEPVEWPPKLTFADGASRPKTVCRQRLLLGSKLWFEDRRPTWDTSKQGGEKMADQLRPDSIEWAIAHIRRHGDTDLLPVPFEYEAIEHPGRASRVILRESTSRPTKHEPPGATWCPSRPSAFASPFNSTPSTRLSTQRWHTSVRRPWKTSEYRKIDESLVHIASRLTTVAICSKNRMAGTTSKPRHKRMHSRAPTKRSSLPTSPTL